MITNTITADNVESVVLRLLEEQEHDFPNEATQQVMYCCELASEERYAIDLPTLEELIEYALTNNFCPKHLRRDK